MKQFEVYRNIRVRALIFGLPLAYFAMLMMAVVASLITVIFSLDLVLLFVAALGNALFYGLLLKLAGDPGLLHMGPSFPVGISNKKITFHGDDDQLS